MGYSVVADWDETGSLFVATVPVLTVCTYGETKEEAMAKMKVAKPATIVGLKHLRRPIPRGDTLGRMTDTVQIIVALGAIGVTVVIPLISAAWILRGRLERLEADLGGRLERSEPNLGGRLDRVESR